MADYDAQPGRAEPTGTVCPAQRDADDVDLLAGLEGVAELVADACSVPELLGDVADFAALAIPHVDGASTALLQRSSGPRLGHLRQRSSSTTSTACNTSRCTRGRV